MVTASVVAHLNTVATSQGDEGFDPPVARIMAHLFQLFIGDGHLVIVLDVILFVKLIEKTTGGELLEEQRAGDFLPARVCFISVGVR